MNLDEYRQEVKDIYKLSLEMFEKSQDDEVYEVILHFRDDEDLIGWGIWNKVFKSFESVEKYILKQREFMDEEDEEPMVNRAYWSVTKYKLNAGEYKELMLCSFSIEMKLLSVRLGLNLWDFLHDEKLYDEIWNHKYLLERPKNIEVPYKTGGTIKVNAMPFGREFYVVYGGESIKGERKKGIMERYDTFYHYCIYESEDRKGLWLSDISDSNFTDYVPLENCPLGCCEPVDSCPDNKLMKVSKKLKGNTELWYELVSFANTIRNGEFNLDQWLFGEI